MPKEKNIYESFDNIFYPAAERDKFREIIRQEVREAVADILIKPSEEKKWREYYKGALKIWSKEK